MFLLIVLPNSYVLSLT